MDDELIYGSVHGWNALDSLDSAFDGTTKSKNCP